jgi:hypothetical protein
MLRWFFFSDTIDDEEALIARLQSFDALVTMRERQYYGGIDLGTDYGGDPARRLGRRATAAGTLADPNLGGFGGTDAGYFGIGADWLDHHRLWQSIRDGCDRLGTEIRRKEGTG